jgi:glycosyltransferase involved in cell wall biosynthesis
VTQSSPPKRFRGDVDPDRERAMGGKCLRKLALTAAKIEYPLARVDMCEQEFPADRKVLRHRFLANGVPDTLEIPHSRGNLAASVASSLWRCAIRGIVRTYGEVPPGRIVRAGTAARVGRTPASASPERVRPAMRIAYDSRAQNDPRGIGRYVRCLLDALRATAPAEATIIETHRPRGSDVFHSPWLEGAQLRSTCPSVVTLHDLVALKRRSECLRTGVRFGLRYLAAQHAERVIVPTHAVANDAQELLSIDASRIAVIPEAADRAMYPRQEAEMAIVRKRYGLPEDYLLWVGGLQHPEPRKRVAALAQASRELPLVLVGPTREWAYELPDVTLTGQVSDDELAAIYSAARALVFPSDDEGFGLPTIEALACGTPVVACDSPAVREVLGDRATFVARGDMEGLLAAGARAERPAASAPAWTWDDAANATWAIYAAVFAQAQGGALRNAHRVAARQAATLPRTLLGPRARREAS